MKVNDFIAEIKANVGKEEEICRKHAVKKYISFIDKVTDCTRIVAATMEYPEGTFKQNTPARYLQLTMMLFIRYTDLEVDESNLIAEYDKLSEAGVLEMLNAALPSHEEIGRAHV